MTNLIAWMKSKKRLNIKTRTIFVIRMTQNSLYSFSQYKVKTKWTDVSESIRWECRGAGQPSCSLHPIKADIYAKHSRL